MNRYFRIREEDGLIVDSVIWDGVSAWSPGTGFYVLPESDNTEARSGWRKLENSWEAPPSKLHYWDGTEWKERIIEEPK